jgi:hypothetical protein
MRSTRCLARYLHSLNAAAAEAHSQLIIFPMMIFPTPPPETQTPVRTLAMVQGKLNVADGRTCAHPALDTRERYSPRNAIANELPE